MKRGDLHCHTRYSDGSATVEEVVRFAKNKGLSFLSITDHDTIEHIPEAQHFGETYGITVLPGTELSCVDKKRGRRVHILCYLPKRPQILAPFCEKVCCDRTQVGEYLLSCVLQEYPISKEDVLAISKHSTALFKQHILYALARAGYTTSIFGPLMKELFHAKTGRFHKQVPYSSVEDVLELVRQAQGVAVLAHPFEYDSIDLLEELAAQKRIQGVEVYHSRCDREQEDKLYALAKHYDLCMTGGSDFHGFFTSKPSPVGNRTVEESVVQRLIALQQKIYQI